LLDQVPGGGDQRSGGAVEVALGGRPVHGNGRFG